jgi:hypothetical protein
MGATSYDPAQFVNNMLLSSCMYLMPLAKSSPRDCISVQKSCSPDVDIDHSIHSRGEAIDFMLVLSRLPIGFGVHGATHNFKLDRSCRCILNYSILWFTFDHKSDNTREGQPCCRVSCERFPRLRNLSKLLAKWVCPKHTLTRGLINMTLDIYKVQWTVCTR